MKFLLDTNIYSQVLKKKPDKHVIAQWERTNESDIVISVVTHAEIKYGLLLAGSEKLKNAFDEILAGRYPILDITPDVADQFAILKAYAQKSGKKTPDLDLLIAGTALTHNLTLVSLNKKHFFWISDLKFESWDH